MRWAFSPTTRASNGEIGSTTLISPDVFGGILIPMFRRLAPRLDAAKMSALFNILVGKQHLKDQVSFVYVHWTQFRPSALFRLLLLSSFLAGSMLCFPKILTFGNSVGETRLSAWALSFFLNLVSIFHFPPFLPIPSFLFCFCCFVVAEHPLPTTVPY